MNELKIVSLACSGEGGVAKSARNAVSLVDQVCSEYPDLVCLPEIFAWTGISPGEWFASSEKIGGTVSGLMAGAAARHRINILCPVIERSGSRIYNSLVWFDRQGKNLGVYRKTFPTDYEMADGISPGPLDFSVFQTEFGPVGACVCFDLNFRPVIERIVRQKARLVIFPAMFEGLSLMRAWAKLCRMYFVSVSGELYASAVDPLGRVLNAPFDHGTIMITSVNLDFAVLSTDYNKAKFPAVRKKYGAKVRIHSQDMVGSAILFSRHPEKTAAEMVAESGLETEADYFRRSAGIRERRLKK